MPSGPSQAFAAIKVRYLFLGLVAVLLVIGIAYAIFDPDESAAVTVPVTDALLASSLYPLMIVFLLIACRRQGVLGELSLGTWPERRQSWLYLSLGIPMIGIAMLGLYVLYLPLSYFAPDFVRSWMLEEPPMIWWQWNWQAVIASGINIFVVVVLAPIVEELFFRGFLFNRLWQKYGLGAAVIISSLAFAIAHVELLGAVVFGAILALIYARTHSLIGPILVHMSNNFLTVILVLVDGMVTGGTSDSTLAEFRGYWWIAVPGAIIGVPWLAWYCWTYLRKSTGSQFEKRVVHPVETE